MVKSTCRGPKFNFPWQLTPVYNTVTGDLIPTPWAPGIRVNKTLMHINFFKSS